MPYYSQRGSMPSGFGMLPTTPYVIKQLLWANFITWFVFAISFAAGIGPLTSLFRWLSMTPDLVISGAIWQVGTYMFLHDPGGLWHVLLNLFALWMFGGVLARDWGSTMFLKFYLTCGVGAAIADVFVRLIMGTPSVATIGASGAVLAVVTAFAVKYPKTPILISFVIPVPAWAVAMGYAALNLIGAAQDLTRGGNPTGTAFTIHLAGMALGYLYAGKKINFLNFNLDSTIRQWKLRRARKKFEIYMKKNDKGQDPWVQ